MSERPKADSGPANSLLGVTAQTKPTRRDFLKRSVAAVAAPAIAGEAAGGDQGAGQNGQAGKRPNIIIIISDQLRWDCVSAYGLSPMGLTPNIDSIAQRGIAFRNAVTNQPWCSPSRACLFTGQYASTHGVWKLGLGLRPGTTTLATELRRQGYTTNYMGKWHLSPSNAAKGEGLGYVPPEYRGGFLDLWQASNILELTSHPYEGTIWDRDGKPIHYEGIYRVDYLTQLAVDFLRQPHEKPFLLVVSQLEPHEQNDMQRPVPPKKYEHTYTNPFVPHDMRFFPGEWQNLLPDYYGAIKAIDDSVGVLLKTLSDQGLADNTIVVMISDHANHFLTRTYAEWKCTPHDSSIHIPLLIQGPGFDYGRMSPDVVSIVDVAPSLLDAVGLKVPDSMQGKSFFPTLNSQELQRQWRQEAFIQFSASAIGRALRTPDWTYCAIDPNQHGMAAPSSATYQDYEMYNLAGDPHQLLNLAGRHETLAVADEFRERLSKRMVEAGEAKPTITSKPYGLYS